MTANQVNYAQMPIKSSFLKLLMRFFGNLSIQLYPVNFKSYKSMLNCTFNLALIAIFASNMSTRQEKYYDTKFLSANMLQILHEKPFFSLIVFTIMKYIFPVCFNIRAIYFLALSLSNSSLIHLLDQLTLKTEVILVDGKSKLYLLFLVVFVQQLFFLFTNTNIILNMAQHFSLAITLLQYVTLFILHINANITFILIFYYKYTTLKALNMAARRFKITKNFTIIQNEISNLALLNFKLNHLIAFPYIFSFVPYIAQMIVALTCLIINQVSEHNVFAVNYLTYNILIVCVCSALEKQLKEIQLLILTYLKNKRQLNSVFKKTRFCQKLSSGIHNDQQSLKWVELVPLYEKCFQFKIYNFFTFNWRFNFLLCIFLCNLVVLVSQTSTTY